MFEDTDTEAGNRAAPITADDVIVLRDHLQIAHHLPGRLRVRVTASAVKDMRGISLTELRQFLEETCEVQTSISKASFSVVIGYNPEHRPPQLWECLINGSEEAARSAFEVLTTATGA